MVLYKEREMEYNYINDLKSDINEFLFSRVNENMTIKDFELLATTIHNVIYESIEDFTV